MPAKPIPDKIKEVFEALSSGQFNNFCLVSCKVNGEDAVAIASVNEDGGVYTITPYFVSITPGMKITGPGDEELERVGG